MKLTVLEWLRDTFLTILGRLIEIFFRIILILLPMGVFLVLIQLREKPSKVSSISVFTNDDSVWQHVFPGFLLVAINPRVLEERWTKIKKNIQSWVEGNKYILSLVFMALIVLIMIIKGN